MVLLAKSWTRGSKNFSSQNRGYQNSEMLVMLSNQADNRTSEYAMPKIKKTEKKSRLQFRKRGSKKPPVSRKKMANKVAKE